ncbi:MAG: amino acid ABC transporter permease [Rhodospirillaceae bacterium]|nr:amino acid ABC transporter permease [Rhodospirillaceae bacterium]
MANTDTFVPLPSRPPPRATSGFLGWLRGNLFSTWYNALITLLLVWFLVELIVPIVRWVVVDATLFSALGTDDPAAVCRQNDGACWAFIAEWWRFILFGRYPYVEQWRPALAVAITIGLWVISCDRRFWNKRLMYFWLVGVPVVYILMSGGILGLTEVPTVNWGGLPLTIGLSTVGLTVAFPLGIFLALGRRSKMPVIRILSIAYIELIRGVPLITVLFMSSLMLPMFLPTGVTIDVLLRAQIGIILFAAAYLAEVVRGGLQAVPRGQFEAADSLGLTYWQKTGLIVLPQALRISIPPLVNTFIGFFKDTSLVSIISLLDLVGAAKQALTNPSWRGFYQESYLFIALIFFIFCFSMSKYSQWLEKHVNTGTRR